MVATERPGQTCLVRLMSPLQRPGPLFGAPRLERSFERGGTAAFEEDERARLQERPSPPAPAAAYRTDDQQARDADGDRYRALDELLAQLVAGVDRLAAQRVDGAGQVLAGGVNLAPAALDLVDRVVRAHAA